MNLLPIVKSYLNLTSAEHDALLFKIIEYVIGLAENFLSSPIARREVVRMTGVFTGKTFLYEINPTVTKVEAWIGDMWQEVEFTQQGNVLSISVPDVVYAKITMQAGWEEVPPAVEMILVKEVAYQFLQTVRGEGRLGKQSVGESVGGGNVSTSYAPSDFLVELSRWRTR